MFGSKKRKKAAEATQALVKDLAAKGQLSSMSPETMQMIAFSADGKISAREARILKQAKRQESRTARTVVRQEEKSVRSTQRSAARAIAYQNGIDPLANAIGASGQIAGAAAAAMMGGGMGGAMDIGGAMGGVFGSGQHDGYGQQTSPDNIEGSIDQALNGSPQNKSFIILIVLAIAAMFLLKK